MTAPLHTLSATALADLIRRHELSPIEVVEAHIERIEAVNPVLNALAAARFEEARAEARAAERQLMSTTDPAALPPLLGVPCTIKEFISVAGMPHTAGVVARRHIRARSHATVVRRVRAAGAIVLGVGNVPEGGMWMETDNKLVGRTNNPWDPRRTAGGSSGGEAALVAAGGAVFGLGSDIGGSVRIPAGFCGVAGHKPTGRMVPNTGHWGAHPAASPYLCIGPIARCVTDLELLLELLAGPDGVDPHARDWPRPALPPGLPDGDLTGVVVYPVDGQGPWRAASVMRAQVARACALLEARGARIGQLDAPLLGSLRTIWLAAMRDLGQGDDGPSFAAMLGDGEPISPARELVRMALGRSQVTAPALGLVLLERVAEWLPDALTARVPRPAALRDQLEAQLGERGVLVLPPYPRPAPRHRVALLSPFAFLGTALFNITEMPATQVPTGFDDRGLPLGVQIGARRGGDALALAVAGALERDLDEWRPAPVLAP
ncbi:amidase [Haliangium sp.]|uniref:amidase n=1 Tax=Haliangium sp. TaxID=2663208 RepID=UPI003D0D6DA5